MADNTTWAKLLKAAAENDGEDFAGLVIAIEPDRRCGEHDGDLMHVEFYASFGGVYGAPRFTAWGAKWVYFPLGSEGVPSVGRAPRNPCDIAMAPQE